MKSPASGQTTTDGGSLFVYSVSSSTCTSRQDEGHPIPVVFNLSTWATKRRPLKEWLVEELKRYDVPNKVAQEWVNTDVLLPLLDGLDEVAEAQRAACVAAINDYWQQQSMSPLAVCSRVADYEALATKLRLQGAVVMQPLTPPQVEVYLDRMTTLLIDKQLLKSQPGDEVRGVAKIRTLTALRRLDGDRNRILTFFLLDADLTGWVSDEIIIDLSAAHLQKANLQGADLTGANL